MTVLAAAHMSIVAVEAKPKLRGVFHQWAAVFAAGAGLVLVAMAPTIKSGLASGVFAISLMALFSISATYHRVTWSVAARARMRRLDHASIFILIAGTYTPVLLLGLPAGEGDTLLVAAWLGALLGIVQSLFWIGAPKWLTALLAVAVGWTIVPRFGEASLALGPLRITLLVLGGVAYTVGAIIYALKRPSLKPGTFGYHELFHLLTLVGAGLHLSVVILTLRAMQ